MIVKAWICFSSFKEVHLGRRERGFWGGFRVSNLEIFSLNFDFGGEIEVIGDGTVAIATNKCMKVETIFLVQRFVEGSQNK